MTKGERAMRNHVIAGVRCDAVMYATVVQLANNADGQAGVVRNAIKWLLNCNLDETDKLLNSVGSDVRTSPRDHKLNNTYLDPEDYDAIKEVAAYSKVGLSSLVRMALVIYFNQNENICAIYERVKKVHPENV